MSKIIKSFISVPQNEHHEYAYVEDVNGTFARFYGPDANENMKIFVDAYCLQAKNFSDLAHVTEPKFFSMDELGLSSGEKP